MTLKEKEAVMGYCSAMAQARRMLGQGILSGEDYALIDEVMLQKYSLKKISLFREQPLISVGNRGNIRR